MIRRLAVVLLLAGARSAIAQDCSGPALQKALLERAAVAQGARKALQEAPTSRDAQDAALRTDADNTAFMRQVLAKCGWPRRSVVGEEAARAAWLLTQHADMDPQYQVLAAQQPLSGHGELVFPSPFYPGKAISDNTLNSALARMGYKGVATAAGAFGVLAPVATLGATVAFAVVVWRTRYVSLGSITAAVLLPVLAFADEVTWPVGVAAWMVAGLVLFRHRDNLRRLRSGREPRLGGRRVVS